LQFETESTICAIATGAPTASGSSGALRGALRISGTSTEEILGAMFSDLVGSLKTCKRASRYQSGIELPELGILRVDIFYWPDHRSYTGEPSAELHVLGAPIFLEQLQLKAIHSGARLARPGEFTLRAFLAGRMDLTQCEAVLGLIHAQSQREFQVALAQLAGGLATPLRQLRKDLIDLLADLEAGLDFVDEDIVFVPRDQVIDRIEKAQEQVGHLQKQIENRQGQGVDFQIAVVGPPNAGKSSLVNALSGADVSIISSTPGTTRDYVRTKVRWGGIPVDLVDTAGVESVAEPGPRAIAQEKTREIIGNADLVILCNSVQERSHFENAKYFGQCSRLWGVWTKSDLTHDGNLLWNIPVQQSFKLSVHTKDGLNALHQELIQAMVRWQEQALDVVPMTGLRCKSALDRAAQSLSCAQQALLDGAGDEIVAGELRLSIGELGEIAGTVTNNDVLDALFSRFCIGK
jgi:tRNA modification GTPase